MMIPRQQRILIIEDDPKTAQALQKGLLVEQFLVDVENDGEEGLQRLFSQAYDCLILDVMLPNRDGFSILQTMRSRELDIPVIMLTARDALDDRVRGLDAGADDYLVKPFAFVELLARTRALLRRGVPEPLQSILSVADLSCDLSLRRVIRAGKEIKLTLMEFDLLAYLMRHQNSIVSRKMLALDVWKETSRVTSLDNVIDVHIAHLRRKVDSHSTLKLIQTVRGIGFTLNLQTENYCSI